MENFEKASKLKLRFATNKGMLSVEDLWELSLISLDNIARAVNKELKEESDESFISAKTTENTVLALKLEILKHIIAFKLTEKEAAAKRAENRGKIATIKNLIAEKELSAMGAKSTEDLQKMLTELESE